MRETQIMGLTVEAQEFLEANCEKVEITCLGCKQDKIKVFDRVVHDSARELGMFNDGPDLFVYNLKDNSRIKEVVQATPWSSGPCIFLCLEDEKGEKKFKWSERAINQV
jgi:hypothetical protein